MVNRKKDKNAIEQNALSKLNKVVYFDEGSATDLIQLYHGGGLEKTLELFESSAKDGEANIETDGKVGLGKILQGIMGIGASVGVGASTSISYASNQMAKNILTNTVLTDFLECAGGDQSGVECLEGYEITTIDNSIASMVLVTPYLTMLRGGQAARSGDFSVSLERVDDAIQKAKGYYEFIARKEDKAPVVLRFNHASFKNNYKLSDLRRMQLIVYAICVGTASLDSFEIDQELKIESFNNDRNPDYPISLDIISEDSKRATENSSTVLYKMYDVILAGVKGNA